MMGFRGARSNRTPRMPTLHGLTRGTGTSTRSCQWGLSTPGNVPNATRYTDAMGPETRDRGIDACRRTTKTQRRERGEIAGLAFGRACSAPSSGGQGVQDPQEKIEHQGIFSSGARAKQMSVFLTDWDCGAGIYFTVNDLHCGPRYCFPFQRTRQVGVIRVIGTCLNDPTTTTKTPR